MVQVDYISHSKRRPQRRRERSDRVETGLQSGEGTSGRALALRSQKGLGVAGCGYVEAWGEAVPQNGQEQRGAAGGVNGRGGMESGRG